MRLEDRNYDELFDKPVTIINGSDSFDGRVAGVDYYIGVTVVDAEDKNNIIYCFPGPNSPLWVPDFEKCHKTIFASTVRQIRKGAINLKYGIEIERITRKAFVLRTPTSESCSFNQ